MLKNLFEKLSDKALYQNAVKFCFDHKNPSVWALQEVFGLDYQKACAIRVRLAKDGYVELFEKKAKKGDIVVLTLNNRIA